MPVTPQRTREYKTEAYKRAYSEYIEKRQAEAAKRQAESLKRQQESQERRKQASASIEEIRQQISPIGQLGASPWIGSQDRARYRHYVPTPSRVSPEAYAQYYNRQQERQRLISRAKAFKASKTR